MIHLLYFKESIETGTSINDKENNIKEMVKILHYKSNHSYLAKTKCHYLPNNFDDYFQKSNEFDDKQDLLNAAHHGDSENFTVLFNEAVSSGINLKSVINPHGENILHIAAGNGHLDIIEKCLCTRKGIALLNCQSDDGSSPLHKAVINDQLNVVKFLLQHNADTSVQNNQNQTAIEMAKEQNKDDISKLFQEFSIAVSTQWNFFPTSSTDVNALHQVFSLYHSSNKKF